MLKAYSKFLDIVEKVISIIVATCLGLMLIFMVYQVVLRYLFHAANSWSEELTRYLFIYSVFLGSMFATRKMRHLTVDMITNLLKPKAQAIMQIISCVAMLVFLVALAKLGYDLVEGVSITGATVAGLRNMPQSYVYACVPIGAVFMILTTVELLFIKISELKTLSLPGTDAGSEADKNNVEKGTNQ